MQQITATGIQGFLKWLQQFQPGIYAKIAPELPRKAPQLFSDFEASGGVAGAATRALSGLADDTSALQPIDITAATDTTSIPTIDVADAANTGTADSSSTGWLSSLINGVSQAYLTVTQQQQQQQIVNAQLQRAQAGLPPLSITATQAGVPQISAGSSTSKLLLIGGGVAAFALILMMSSKRR
ncbi:MAG: hypothetical protein ACREJ2_11730 [Planctomycetota bacterium]